MNQAHVLTGKQDSDINGKSGLEGKRHWMIWLHIDKNYIHNEV